MLLEQTESVFNSMMIPMDAKISETFEKKLLKPLKNARPLIFKKINTTVVRTVLVMYQFIIKNLNI